MQVNKSENPKPVLSFIKLTKGVNMKTRKLISGIILSASVSMGAAQADNITTRDDLFAYLQIGKVNSIESVETTDCKNLGARDANPASMGVVQASKITTRDDLFDL